MLLCPAKLMAIAGYPELHYSPNMDAAWINNYGHNMLTVLHEMLQDRYPHNGTVTQCKVSEIGDFGARGKPIVTSTQSGESSSCKALFDSRLGIKQIRDYQELRKSDPTTDFIIVSMCSPTPAALKCIAESAEWLSFFKCNEVVQNVTKHCLVPKHTLLSDSDRETLIRRLKIPNVEVLPQMLTTDPVSRYYNFQPGTVVRLELKNGVQEAQDYFVHVVSPPCA